jgi:signal transduction histidine kinase
MMRLLRQISAWGITPETSPLRATHYRLTNVLLTYMFFASLLQTAFLMITGAFYSGLLNAGAPLTFGLGLLLMRSGQTVTARVLVFVVSCTVGYEFIASVGPESGFETIFLFASALAIGMFSIEEKVLLAFGIIAPLITFVSLEMTNFKPLFMSRALLSAERLATMRVFSNVSVWCLMVGHFLYFVYDRRRSQEQLINSAKMVALGRMASGVAHEVNNPLQLIMSHAEKMKTLTDPGEILKRSEQIQSVAMRIATINKGLLTLSRDAKADPLTPVSLRSVVDLALEFCQARFESEAIELRLVDFPKSYMVSGRETQLAEVLLNVLTNAHDAVEAERERWVEISVVAQRNSFDLIVTDSGRGISPETLERIFDPFFTTKPAGRGTGLGLSICRAVMTDHGGEIFYDRKRAGPSFVIRIPCADELPAASPQMSTPVSV